VNVCVCVSRRMHIFARIDDYGCQITRSTFQKILDGTHTNTHTRIHTLTHTHTHAHKHTHTHTHTQF
jgi:hypothetical protein